MSGTLAALSDEAHVKWRALGMRPFPGASSAAIRELEDRLRVRLPSAFETWLRAVGGTEDGDWDDAYIRFWTFAELALDEPDPQQPIVATPRPLLVFADWSISAHEYAVSTHDESGSVWLLGAEQPIQISVSFTSFVAAYLHDPRRLFA